MLMALSTLAFDAVRINHSQSNLDLDSQFPEGRVHLDLAPQPTGALTGYRSMMFQCTSTKKTGWHP